MRSSGGGASIQRARTVQPREGGGGASLRYRRRPQRRSVGVGAFRDAHPRVKRRVLPQHAIATERHVLKPKRDGLANFSSVCLPMAMAFVITPGLSAFSELDYLSFKQSRFL